MYNNHVTQGFLQAELVSEACRGLHKRCVSATEQLMQSMEALDGIVRELSPVCIHTREYATLYQFGMLEQKHILPVSIPSGNISNRVFGQREEKGSHY